MGGSETRPYVGILDAPGGDHVDRGLDSRPVSGTGQALHGNDDGFRQVSFQGEGTLTELSLGNQQQLPGRGAAFEVGVGLRGVGQGVFAVNLELE